jgi:hypothetical protein
LFSVDTEKPIFVFPPDAAGAAGAALATAAGLALASLAAVVVEGDSLFEQPESAAAAHKTAVPVRAPSLLHASNLPEFQAMTVSIFQVIKAVLLRAAVQHLKQLIVQLSCGLRGP